MLGHLVLGFTCVSFLSIVSAQILQNGQCDPNVPLQTNFNPDLFLGTWYEVGRTADQNGGDCSTWEVARAANNFVFTYDSVNDNIVAGQSAQGTLVANTARFTLNFGTTSEDFWILGTNYQDYAIGYRCENVGTTQRNIYIRHLGRSATINPTFTNVMNNLVAPLGISLSELRSVDHSDNACFALPSIARGQPVILPGQCDPNISLLSNFDAGRFVGRWFEIQSYYSENALGTCARAEYSLGDGVVNVVNSQVVNQALDTITGTATVADAANARLTVNLEILPGVFSSQDLWVIDTDYETYAITYSCQDVTNSTKRVFSWIASKQTQLSATAQQAVNQVVASILDLNYAYYAPGDQSEEACFYFPEPSSNGPPQFPGTCDLNIPAVANFDAVAYMGLWHDIESYPTTFQQGTCNNAFYTLIDGKVDVFNTQVINQALDTIRGEAVLVSTDGSAKLEVSFPVAGTNLTTATSYWVLATDYSSYSLVYTCDYNSATDMKTVYSWKLSRTKTLTAAANTAINTAIANIDVLDPMYYVAKDQSPQACFYFPEPSSNGPPQFPGACDLNIPAVANFDAVAYMGLWHDIESYPTTFQQGTCNNAFYTLIDGKVDVFNTQVINQALDTIRGEAVLVSTDGSAKLEVSFPVAGTNLTTATSYWVLATDYSSYSLVYTCDYNSATDMKTVYSWKLSRTKTLTSTANAAINTAIANIDVLDPMYYVAKDQSPQACFYFPEPSSNGPPQFPGACDLNIPAVANFDAVAYMGLWHDIESYPTTFQQGSCNNAFYTLIDGKVDVFNTQVINQALDTIRGEAVLVSTDGSAKLEVSFPVAGTNLTTATSYWVLATDYSSYSLVYTCDYNSATDMKTVYSWKLSRTKTLTAAANTAINTAIANIDVLDPMYYVAKDQSPQACFYFPEPSSNGPPQFPGACDLNIPAVANFDAVAYMGLWHDIESYPTTFQQGTCNNAFYTLIDGKVDVFNTQVINQALDTIRGEAVLVSTDGSAKLEVSFPVAGTNLTTATSYWVLATDYSSYSLVYTCDYNSATDMKTVYSWKLSRTKTLTAAANTAINTAIANIDVLDPMYYVAKDQSPQACFYFPEPSSNGPPQFPGACDLNIPAVANFDAVAYMGLWHDIESYPTTFQQGTCNNAFYTLIDGKVDVFNTQVINQALDTIRGEAVLVSTDGSAKLEVSFPVAGTNLTTATSYWVLATDYSSYSLVYTCDYNSATDMKTVYSWKLSRTKTLTAAANTAINTAIANIDVLDPMYYVAKDQSPQACFYFPEPSSNGPPQFPGACDLNIPAVANFDAVAYMGLWHDIESYPTTFQQGTCNNAFYTLIDGKVDVFNTQVINQALDTIRGEAVLVSTDGSAKLEVSFPVAGTNLTTATSYWVLATDYSSYSLVYTCDYNSATDMKTVYSWKLSRTKTLTAAANTAINTAIANIDVLDQMYYVAKDQSPEGCFYFPEPASGVPVVFPGQCDNSIAVATNFNLNQFAETWYEIETYPKEQAGECVQHVYTAGTGNTLNLVSSFLVEQFQQSSTSVLAFSSNDTNARFTIRINIGNNEEITIPFWILSIDYNDFAFAYSCMNLNTDYRAVYSWKLSRNRQQLSAAANTEITRVISTVDTLEQRYFETVDQTEGGCNPLPEIPAGQPIILPGQCDLTIPVVQSFDAGRYVGLWHLVESYWSEYQNGDCNDATYTAQADGTVLVFNTQVINQTLDTITGEARVASTDGSAKLVVTFPDSPIPTDYWVIDTDYDSYALVYSCINLSNDTQQIWSWKMSRTRSLTEEAANNINRAINDVRVLNNRFYYIIDNSNQACFYYPEADGSPLVFRGQCDETIPVVTNFDAVAYMSLWYDIESYPQAFQDGTCATAEYSLIEGGVNVFNTQVVNQTLDVITGRAVLVETDNGEAKLIVTFPISEFDSPYWVLSTDYTNYALVYSCQNIGPDSRYVSSWKLSRSRTLSTPAQTAINNVISGIDILQQDYYEVKGHTDADCFYYPEPTGDVAVFRGQCDNTIQALPNFDLERFSGVWNEIETYPKEQAGGQCINHQFTASATSNTTLQLVSNQTFDSETLVSNNGQIVLASTDSSGRFTLTITTGTQTITIPYWILDTDYTDYALAYSCMNRDTETRAVYSWKLSRSKQLSNAANIAIANAITSVDVLHQQYYEPVSHTDNACFYLPKTGANEPAVFTGQCDPNIPVVNNFEGSRFAGRWFDIESYFDEYQGTCIDATFTQIGNSYEVLFTQVVNQTLDSTSSTATLAVDNTGKLLVTTNGVQYEYWILDTDYSSWALVYSCQNVGTEQRRVRSWKMSRTRELSNVTNIPINAIINSINVLNERFFITRDHSDNACFYLPEPTGNPVTFRGRCDDTIEVVKDFDVAAYLGQWYDIQSYPQFFQDGECSTAYYSLGSGGVDVFNTQVVNQQLDTINGTAVVASTDGSAKLNVTFVVQGIEGVTPYWVLSTDYTHYSLVYSCFEIDDEYKRVAAWKLSRTRSLTTAAELAINQVMSNVIELDDQYFRTIGHTEEDCFYYPDNNGGPVILDGQCPEPSQVQAVTNFNVNAFSGTWHEVSRFPSELQDGECASNEYSVNNENTFDITAGIVVDERLVTATGTGSVSTDGRGVISATLTGDQFATSIDVYVLDTDYSEFAVLYSCENRGNSARQIYSWKLSRSRTGLSQAANDRINALVSNNTDLFESYYDSTEQSNDACFYYPEFENLPDSIELPGPCNEAIRGISNFNAEAYLGRWFEIAKYPQPFQFGECAQATYSLGDNVVDVYNTQVFNRTLLIQTGYAVVASDDGTGQLQVTFVVNGQTNEANYYILDTDYTTYSLVYSCRNLDNGNSEVASWKLSRDRTLSNPANQAIANTISNTRGLLEDFYVETSQSDEACFYLPEPNPEEYVVLPGQCGDISGVQNFNIQNYLGVWHEVERYPTGQNDGVCISADFRASGSQFEVVDTSIFDVTANFATNTVAVTTNGRITRTTAQGSTDVWVLATDYTTYSLLYSCENIDDEYRRVWSAKHSRARVLPQAAENAITEVMASNNLIHQQFFVAVDQSDSACFYYPAVTGEPVVLPGQCDENIPVMQDFSLAAYTGTWYQVERYPQTYETGDCTGAKYTLNEETGIVEVLNWEVIDGELETIEGTASLITEDGSAKFEVELPSRQEEGETVTMNLYVLTTDYVTYALSYSCVNINQYQRQLGVWKLSRERTMPELGVNAINDYMATRPELDQRYFISVDQNEDCEEPSSSYLIKSSIIVLLVCSLLQLFM